MLVLGAGVALSTHQRGAQLCRGSDGEDHPEGDMFRNSRIRPHTRGASRSTVPRALATRVRLRMRSSATTHQAPFPGTMDGLKD